MEFLRKILRIVISIFIPFVLLAKIENTYILYRENLILPGGEVTIYDIKLLFSLTMPVLFAAACVIQYVLIVPVWDKLMAKKASLLIVLSAIMGLIALISFGLSYLAWERPGGTYILFKSIAVLALTQLLYWILNFLTLFLLDKVYYTKHKLSHLPTPI